MTSGYGYRSEQRLRKENQDTLGVFQFQDCTVLVVCDGMGGHAGGSYASKVAVRRIHDYFDAKSEDISPLDAVQEAIEAANEAIFEASQRNYRLNGMGTTCVLVMVVDSTAYLAHVGDSRIYLFRNRTLSQLTRDHTMVNMFVDAGLLSQEDAATHPEAHVLSRSLGIADTVEVEVGRPINLEPEDRLLLCSDGVHGVLKTKDYAKLDIRSPQAAADRLMDIIEERRGDDNASLIFYAPEADSEVLPLTPVPEIGELLDAGLNDLPSAEIPVNAQLNTPVTFTPELGDISEEELPEIDIEPEAITPAPAAKAPSSERSKAIPALMGAVAIAGCFAIAFSMQEASEKPIPVASAALQSPQLSDGAAPQNAQAQVSAALSMATTAPSPQAADASPQEGVQDVAQAQIAVETTPADLPEAEMEPAPGPASQDGSEATPSAEPTPVEPPKPLSLGRVSLSALTPRSLVFLTPVQSFGAVTPSSDEAFIEPLFAPLSLNAPVRVEHTPTVYTAVPPRSVQQVALLDAVHNDRCEDALYEAYDAVRLSPDNATLYGKVWHCFTRRDTQPLTELSPVEDFAAMKTVIHHLDGSFAAVGAAGQTPAVPYSAPPEGGVEGRLHFFLNEDGSPSFSDVVTDLFGEEAIADTLGLDLLYNAQVAASLSRIEGLPPEFEVAWARRVHQVTQAMNSDLGLLLRRQRPDLTQVIDVLLFEATGQGRIEPFDENVSAEALPEEVLMAWRKGLNPQWIPRSVRERQRLAAARAAQKRREDRINKESITAEIYRISKKDSLGDSPF